MLREKKKLEDLTTQELGKLFPIEIVPYNNSWRNLYSEESKLIQETLGQDIALKIEHFGSTAVEGLSAKPIIDILVEIPPLTDELKDFIIKRMKEIRYNFIWRTDDQVPYMNFVKGYTMNGFNGDVFHAHMADKQHTLWDRIYFRDHLKKHPQIAKDYEKLKLELADKYKFDREAYTNAKGEFVKRITEIAKK